MIQFSSKLLSVVLVVAAVVASFLLGGKLTVAQPAGKSWSDVQVVTYAAGLTGFFDRANGKLYLYDSNLEQPVATRQLEELGKPMKKIR